MKSDSSRRDKIYHFSLLTSHLFRSKKSQNGISINFETLPNKIMADTKLLPTWAEDLRKRYLRGESSMFILHGNVFDVVLNDGKMLGLTEFLTDVLLKDSRESIVAYNLSSGTRFPKRTETFSRLAINRRRKRQGKSSHDA